jgi:toxin secretion/phage lysis holin
MGGLGEHGVAKGVVAVWAGVIIHLLFGDWTPLLTAVVVLVGLDTLIGFARAWKEHSLSSEKMRAGAVKLVVYFGLLVVGHQVSVAIGGLGWVRDALATYLALTEALSILEHGEALGVPVPAWLAKVLQSERDKGVEANEGRKE